ncbi:MAG: hypothetical protein ACI36Y_07480 [Coriobacteriales bacterium]
MAGRVWRGAQFFQGAENIGNSDWEVKDAYEASEDGQRSGMTEPITFE